MNERITIFFFFILASINVFAFTDAEKLARANNLLGNKYPHANYANQISVHYDYNANFICESYAWKLRELSKYARKVVGEALDFSIDEYDPSKKSQTLTKTALPLAEASIGWEKAADEFERIAFMYGLYAASKDIPVEPVGYYYSFRIDNKFHVIYFDNDLTEIMKVVIYDNESETYLK